MAFGEAGLPAHPLLREALADAAGCTAYGPVAGHAALREAAASYWDRRGLPTDAEAVVAGPGSKALLFGLIAAIGGDVAVTRPSWVSYAAQASLAGRTAHFVPGSGGVPDAAKLARTVAVARASGRPVRAVIVTLPDNPTGTLACADAVRALCSVAERHGLIIISDEIYRDLVHDQVADITSPATISAERTVVTSGLSKNLALGGWRLGVARLPDGRLGRELRTRLLGIGSEVWSAPAGPVQQAAALAFARAGAAGGADRAQPPAARPGGPRGGVPVRVGRRVGAAAPGGVLPVSGLHPARGDAAAPARGHQRRGPGGPAPAAVRPGRAAGQRVRRPAVAAAAAGGDRAALRRDRRAAERRAERG